MRSKTISLILSLLITIELVLPLATPRPVQARASDELGGLYAGTSHPGVVYKYVGGTQWEAISLAPISESLNIESPHPYPNYYDNTWTETRSEARMVRVHFAYIRTESGYDYVYVKDSAGNIIDSYSGHYTDVWTEWIFDNTIQIQLTSDYSVVDDGFVVDRLEWSTQGHLGYAVLSLIEYGGHLYAGTTSMDGGGIGRVYRYDGGTSWALVGDNMDHAVCSLAVYQGDLYAGTAWSGMKLYRYEGGTTWTQVIDPVMWNGTRALHISHGLLLMGDIVWDRMGHWDGSTFTPDQPSETGSCIYDYEDFGGYVYSAAYEGRMWRSSDAINWDVVLDYYEPDYPNMWELEGFRDLLYMSYNNGELRATEGRTDLRGTFVYQALDGIISMTTDGDYLYLGTGGDAVGVGSETTGIANIYKYNGTDVVLISNEDEFGAGVQVLYTTCPVAPNGLNVCELEKGDIIIVNATDLLYKFENALYGGYWGHTGIYYGDGQIVESYSDGYWPVDTPGVVRRPISESGFWEAKDWVVLRLKAEYDSGKANEAAQYAKAQPGKPYNWNFPHKEYTGTYYCTSLVWRSYYTGTNPIDIDSNNSVCRVLQSWCEAAVTPDDIFYSRQYLDIATSREYKRTVLYLSSPANFYITDPQGRHVGVDSSTGEVVNEMPDDVFYSGPDAEPEVVAILDMNGVWDVEVIGTAAGLYTFVTEAANRETHKTETITETTSPGEIDEYEVIYPLTKIYLPIILRNYSGNELK